MMINIKISTKDIIPASTISTQLLLTNLLLALADLGGLTGSIALLVALLGMPFLVGYLRKIPLRHLLGKAGHAANDLRVLIKRRQSWLGKVPRNFTMFFSFFCTFIRPFQLQSSKVSDVSKFDLYHKIVFLLFFNIKILIF